MGEKTTVDLLNELLEAERSGVVVFEHMSFFSSRKDANRVFSIIRNNESRDCAMLHALISRRQVRPSDNINGFAEKMMALEDEHERIELAIKGCAWVTRKITEFTEADLTEEEREFLLGMHRQHIWNIGVMREFLKLKKEQ